MKIKYRTSLHQKGRETKERQRGRERERESLSYRFVVPSAQARASFHSLLYTELSLSSLSLFLLLSPPPRLPSHVSFRLPPSPRLHPTFGRFRFDVASMDEQTRVSLSKNVVRTMRDLVLETHQGSIPPTFSDCARSSANLD